LRGEFIRCSPMHSQCVCGPTGRATKRNFAMAIVRAMRNVVACMRCTEPSEFRNRDMCRANGEIILLRLNANDRFHSGNRDAHEIFRNMHSQHGLERGAIAHMLANKVPHVRFADRIIRRSGSENPEQNPFGRICSRKRRKGGCVTTALRIIVKLRSADQAHAQLGD